MEFDITKLLKFTIFIIGLFMIMWPDDNGKIN